MGALALDFLTCLRCGAPTPLVGSSQVKCLYCAATLDVPARIRAPIRKFHRELDELKQRAFDHDGDPTERWSTALAALMGLVIAFYLVWWWHVFVESVGALPLAVVIILGDLIALPLALMFLSLLFAGGELDYSRKASLTFATLRFDTASLMTDALGCSHCGAPLDYRETRDVVVECRHCRRQFLIPWLLLNDQLQGVLERVIALRGARYNRYEIRKWVLIALTAINGTVPLFILSSTPVWAQHLGYLTGFSWSYLHNSLFTAWARLKRNGTTAVIVFITLIPLPVFFLFQLARVLLGLNPDRW